MLKKCLPYLLFSLAVLFIFNLFVPQVVAKDLSFEDFIGSYTLEDSFIKEISVEEDQVILYLDDIEQAIGKDDPLEEVYLQIKNFVANEPRQDLADPTESNQDSLLIAKASYRENKDTDHEASHQLVFEDLIQSAMVQDNRLELALNDKYLFQLAKDKDGNLVDDQHQVTFNKQ